MAVDEGGAMRTNRDNEGPLEATIRAWARTAGVTDAHPVHVAVEKATHAYRHGASVAEAAGIARAFVLCWQRHPANTAQRARIVA
jgi:hypothetical protein